MLKNFISYKPFNKIVVLQRRVIGENGEVVRRISLEAKQALMNAFRRELSLKLAVKGSPDFYKSKKLKKDSS